MDKHNRKVNLRLSFDKGNLESIKVLEKYENGHILDYCTPSQNYNAIELRSSLRHKKDGRISTIGKPLMSQHPVLSCGLIPDLNHDSHMAGLQVWYNDKESYSLSIIGGKKENLLRITSTHKNKKEFHPKLSIPIKFGTKIELKIKIESEKILFYYAEKKYRWHKIGPSLSTSGIPIEEDKANQNKLFGGMFVESSDKSICCASFYKFSLKDA